MRSTLADTSLQARLIWLVIVVAIPYSALLIWHQIQEEREARDAVYTRMEAQSRASAFVIAQYFQEQREVLGLLALRPAVQALNGAECDPLLLSYPSLHTEFTNLTLRRPDGELVCSYLTGPIGPLSPEFQKFAESSMQSGASQVSGVIKGTTTRRDVAVTAVPVKPMTGSAAGVLMLGSDLQKLNALVFMDTPADVTVAVFDRSETIALRSQDPAKWIGQPIAAANRGKYNQEPTGRASVSAVDGVRRMYAWTTIPTLGWRVTSGVSEELAMGPYFESRNNTLAANALLILLALYLAYRLALSIARPLGHLEHVARRIAQDDMEARARVTGPRELRALATQFNRMLDVRTQTLTELRDSEMRWKFAIEGAGDGLWDWDMEVGTVYFSSRWKSMLGYSEAEVGNTLADWSDRVHPDDMPAVMADLQAHLDGTTPGYTNEHRVRCKDGSHKWILDRGLVVRRDRQGKALRVVGTHSDITQRKLQQEALRNSEAQYRELLDASPVPCALNDSAQNIVFLNRAFTETFGYTLADLPNLSAWWPLAYPDPDYQAWVMSTWQERRQAAFAAKVPFHHVELRIRGKSGQDHTVMASAAALSNPLGDVHLVVLVDITERKAMEETLRTSADLLEYSQSVAKVGGWELTLATGHLYWTAETYRIHETTPEAFNPTVDAGVSYFVPESRERITRALQLAMEEGLGYELELQTYTTQGRLIDVFTTCTVSLQDGKPAKLTGIFEDITEQKVAVRALQTSQTGLASVINYAMDAIINIDAAHKITLFNPAAEKMFGYSAAQMLGEPLDRLIPQGMRAGHSAHIEGFGRSEHRSRMMGRAGEIKALRASGEEFFIEPSISQTVIEGERVFTVMMRDISERVKATRQVQEINQELARSNADLEQFAYVASHDLQEPLRSVSSSVQLLKRRYQGALDDRANEFIAHAVGGVERMQDIINDLLAYSRISAGPRVLRAAPLDGALQVALANLARSLAASDAQVTHDPLPTLQANPQQMAQLFQNLIGNALKFRGDKPAVVHIGAQDLGTEWQFSVADQGIGIEPTYFERIFKLFQRLHTRTEYAGTGIGLTICQKIVERHGGRIWVESVQGQGTTFYFTLPYETLPKQ